MLESKANFFIDVYTKADGLHGEFCFGSNCLFGPQNVLKICHHISLLHVPNVGINYI